MKRRKVIKLLWIVLSCIVVLSMVAWTATLGLNR
jgi:hypothetical protein